MFNYTHITALCFICCIYIYQIWTCIISKSAKLCAQQTKGKQVGIESNKKESKRTSCTWVVLYCYIFHRYPELALRVNVCIKYVLHTYKNPPPIPLPAEKQKRKVHVHSDLPTQISSVLMAADLFSLPGHPSRSRNPSAS